jgi:serine/threonine-protein kinase
MVLRGGRYETIGRIASGGMATVHLGRAIGPGGFERLVAIKTMHEHLASDPEFVAMFLDEARLAARIHHPNVVATLDVGEDEQGIFLVMEYVEGPALSELLRAERRQGRRLPYDIALRILLDMLAGLHVAHELRGASGEPLHLVHRDVSPHNILVGVDGAARLMDFGVARAQGRLSSTQAGQIKGKVAFMAPEQLEDGPIDRGADVYAAGVVLWEVLTGQRMLSADHGGALLVKALRSERRSPREVDPDIPQALEAATMRALRPKPSERFATAADFARALEAAGVPIASGAAVGAFVQALGIHQRPLAAGEPGEVATGWTGELAVPPGEPESPPAGEGSALRPSVHTATVVTPAPSSLRALVAAGVSGAVLVTLLLVLARGGSGAAAPATTAPVPAPPPSQSAPAPAVPVESAAPAPAPVSSATVEPRPDRGRAAPRVKATASSAPPAPPNSARPSSTSFVPREL